MSKKLIKANGAAPASDPNEAAEGADGESEKLQLTPDLISQLGQAFGKPDASVEDIIGMMRALLAGVSGEAPPAAADGMAASAAADCGDPSPKEQMASRAILLRTTGKESDLEALAEIDAWKVSHLSLASQRAQLEAQRMTLEGAERVKICASFVLLGAETPATAWEDPAAKTLKPSAFFASMPLPMLRDRVAKLTAAKGKPVVKSDMQAPVSASGDHDLTDREIAMCKARKVDPSVYAAKRADIRARSTHHTTSTPES